MVIRWWKLALALFFSALLLQSCGREFEPYWRVDKLRVMAVKADPVVARTFQPVTLSALVYAPPGQEIRYSWSWCPIQTSAADDYECNLDSDFLADLAPDDGGNGNGNGPDIEEGLASLLLNADQPEATFFNPFTEDQVRELCEAIVQAVLEQFDDPELAGLLPGGDCSQGYQISVRLEVQAGDERVVTAKRLTLSGGAEEINENPRMEGIEIRPADPDNLPRLRDLPGWTDLPADADHDDQWLLLTDQAALPVLPDLSFEIRGLVDPDSLQTYTPPTPQGQTTPREPREEALVFRYFTTVGSLGGSRRLFAPDQNEITEAAITTWRVSPDQIRTTCLERAGDPCIVRLFSVVRDSRLGLDWSEGILQVEE